MLLRHFILQREATTTFHYASHETEQMLAKLINEKFLL